MTNSRRLSAVAVLLGALTAASPAAATNSVISWGGVGSADGLGLSPAGNVYVADGNNDLVREFTPDGALVRTFDLGAPGGQQGPVDVATDAAGNVYVAELSVRKIKKLSSTGSPLGEWGTTGAPKSIVVDSSSNVYVAEINSGGQQVEKFSSSGTPLSTLTGDGTPAGTFALPWGLALGSSDSLYVADWDRHTVDKFDSAGNFIRRYGSFGFAPGQFNNPSGVAVGSATGIVVADINNNRLQRFADDGTYLTRWGRHGSREGHADFSPKDALIDSQGRLFVSEPGFVWRIDTTIPYAYLAPVPSAVLTGTNVALDASLSAPPEESSATYRWDLDGDGTYEISTGGTPTAETSFSRAGRFEVGVQLRAGDGATDTSRQSIDVRLAPPAGPLGASINSGALFTNNPNVNVSLVWPRFAVSALISNDGGFVPASTLPVAPSIPWTLDSSGPERLPKTVYVRFLEGDSGPQTYQDDIILDDTPPKILSAKVIGPRASAVALQRTSKKRRYRIQLRARDNVSGVASLQVTQNRKKPGKWRRYRSRLTYRGVRNRRIFVRARDKAGNRSRWRKVKR